MEIFVVNGRKIQNVGDYNEYTDGQNHQLAGSIFNESINLMRAQLQIDLYAMAEYEQRKRDEDNADDDSDIEMKNEIKTADVDATGTVKKDSTPKISLLAKWLPRENSHFLLKAISTEFLEK